MRHGTGSTRRNSQNAWPSLWGPTRNVYSRFQLPGNNGGLWLADLSSGLLLLDLMVLPSTPPAGFHGIHSKTHQPCSSRALPEAKEPLCRIPDAHDIMAVKP